MATFTKDFLKEAQDGKLTLESDGKIKEFIAPIEGMRVDGSLTAEGVLAAWSCRFIDSTNCFCSRLAKNRRC
jgi:hypothetical protein